MADFIGIRIADGTMRTLFDSNYRGRKRMIIATASDNQENVRVGVFKSSDVQFANSERLCELHLENLLPLPQGETEIELTISIDDSGYLSAMATDQISGERTQAFVPILATQGALANRSPGVQQDDGADWDSTVSVPASDDIGLDPQISYDDSSQTMDQEEKRRMRKRKRRRFVALIGYLLISLAILGVLIYLFYNALQNEFVPPLVSGSITVLLSI